ncbi:hypothetical protein ACG2LH_07220 [Zhouia sp. PK063]|uniref:hypothetical protein n=1 Tax=Zhouia sp. PK063 TaxID=3373602 RepID=UPI00379EB9CC
MQLYKIRTFGDLISDTFTFLKQNGSHYYKNFLIVCGPFILAYLVTFIFLFKYSITNLNSQTTDVFPIYMFLIIGIICFIAFMLMIIMYSFTPIYYKLYNEKGEGNFTTADIVTAFKNNAGKMILFFLTSILVGILSIILLVLVMAIFAITIIGILGWPLIFAFYILWFNNALAEYLNSSKNPFEVFFYSFTLIFKGFWKNVGATTILLLAINIIMFALNITIQLIAGVGFANGLSNLMQDVENTSIVIISIIYILIMLINIFCYSIFQNNLTLIYFSSKEELENINTQDDIDLIGSAE